jgi:hypothetical protein
MNGIAMQLLLEDPTEVSARAVLRHAADYLYEHQMGSPARVSAMDMLDDIRRDYANWQDLSAIYGVQHRTYPVFRPSRYGEDLEAGQSGKCEDCGSGCCPDCGEPTENGKQCAGCITAERTRQ